MSPEKSTVMPTSSLASAREAAGMSQAELAALAGVSRAAVSSMENGTASPSVHAALAVAEVLGLPVEELFGSKPAGAQAAPMWAWGPAGGATRFWELREPGRILRYPVESLAMNPLRPDGAVSGRGMKSADHAAPPPTLALACCDPAARLLAAEFERHGGVRMLVFPRNGAEALRLVGEGIVHLGGLHASTRDEPEANLERVRKALGSGWVLVRAASWESGLTLPSADRRLRKPPANLARRPWAMRERGAVARETMERLTEGKRMSGRLVAGHQEVAAAIRSGWATAGISVRLCAEEHGLAFVPLRREALDLVFHQKWMADRRFKMFIEHVGSRAYRELVTSLPGYDGRDCGLVQAT